MKLQTLKQSYTFKEVVYPPGLPAVVNSINNHGDYVGVYLDALGEIHGFVNIDGEYQTVDHPEGEATYVQAIDDAGVAYGDFQAGDGSYHAFSYADGEFSAMSIAPELNPDASVGGAARQHSGVICGVLTSDENGRQGFIFDGNDTELIDYPESFSTYIFGMNSLGETVGAYLTAYLTQQAAPKKGIKRDADGTLHVLPTPEKAHSVMAYDISDSGTITAQWFPSDSSYELGFNPDAPQGMIIEDDEYFDFRYPDAVHTGPVGMNDQGVVVGFFDDNKGTRRGFIATPDCGLPHG